MKQESIDLTGSDSESDDDDASLICRNLFMSQNSDEPSSASSPTAVDVSHLFDFSSANNVPGPAYIDEDEDNDRDLPVIFRSLSPLRSPLPCTPNHRTEGYSLRPRPRPSRNDTPTYSEPPAKRCKNHGNGEENPGWKKAYNWLLKKHGDLQQEYSMLKEKIEMAKRVEQGQGQGASRSPSHLSDVTNRGATVLGGTGHMNQRPYVSNVYSLLS
ncbi:uncharacterized protein EV420DRAFT_522322 [Desarmillaria tabescens]|uniref:Uncharacterized protein n=1 Tax=Armillaria tabescens TaxID=1929756 RepID=A0AA39N4Q5_ARMTA|nr:uncharacterized protein EV420DRAFT_522322 [Desarmillaria tabescens]KAK0457354.1 hypothetical protein EV420DRAFT_522322 [Desarmillaria tabescens]